MKKFKFLLYFISICLILTACQSDKKTIKAKLNEKTYTFELALTHEEKAKGLMFRKKLSTNGGMLFVYGYATYLEFYMKNTLIPLDLAFIDAEKKIISIEDMKPFDETTVASPKKAMYVLEVNKGFFAKNGIKVGDSITFLSPLPYIIE